MSMKRIFTSLFLIVLLLQVVNLAMPEIEMVDNALGSEQINVKGIISSNTTWKNTTGPYVIKSNVLVDKNATLTIEPGVDVLFDGNYYIKVQGNLIAKGTEKERINFTSNKTIKKNNDWNMIELDNVESVNLTSIQFCNIEYCTNGINIIDSAVDIRNNTFGYVGQGIYCYRSASGLTENLTRILNITGNIMNGTTNHGIRIISYEDALIEGNVLYNMSGKAMFIASCEVDDHPPIIRNNTIKNVNIGIQIGAANPLIENNIITNSYSGIFMLGNDLHPSYPVILNNTMGGNEVSVFVSVYTYPKIQHNNFIKDQGYIIEHNGKTNVNASSNYFGTTNRSRIKELIFDYYDDFNYAKLLIDPILKNRSDGAPNVTINLPPVADAGPDIEVNMTETFLLNATRSYDPDGDDLKYKWDLDKSGGETTGWIDTPTKEYVFMDYGTRFVHLYVSDGEFIDEDTFTIRVDYLQLDEPVAVASASQEIIYEGENITLNSSASYDPDGEIVNRSWYSNKDGILGFDEIITVELGQGLHEITLTVKDDDGLFGRDILYVAVAQNLSNGSGSDPGNRLTSPPVPVIDFSKKILISGDPLVLDGSMSFDPDGNITQYVWTSDIQGLLGIGKIIEALLTEGLHLVQLTVFDEQGLKNSTTATVLVKEKDAPKIEPELPPIARMNFSRKVIIFGDPFILDGSLSSDPDGNITEYHWKSDSQGELGFGKRIEVYLTEGLHIIELTVLDDQNLTGISTASVLVKEKIIPDTVLFSPIPIAFSSRDLMVGIGTITLNGAGSYDPDGTIQKYDWYSSISGYLDSGSIIMVELGIGTHLISLVVTDGDGISNTTYVAVSVIERDETHLDDDGDGVLNDHDAFPDDPAASIDLDMDGYPDMWNPGMGIDDSSTGLELDHYPDDGERWSMEMEISHEKDRPYWVIAFIVLILSVIVIASVIVPRDRISGDERRLRRLRKEINDENQFGIRNFDPIERSRKLEDMKEEDMISDRTYREIKDIIMSEERREKR